LTARIQIPGPLRRLVNDAAEVDVDGATVLETIRNLEAANPGLRNRLTTSDGQIRRFIRIFLNDEDTDRLGGAQTPVRDGDVITIVPAAAGG
jgi:sulfur-carrier protein